MEQIYTLQTWKRLLKTNEGTAVLAGICFGLMTHLYGIVTILHNYDSIAVQPNGYGTGVTSGRWFLQILGDLVTKAGGNYNTAAPNAILFLLLLAMSAGVLTNVLEIKNKLSAAAVGMLFVAFPSATATMFFRYTTVYYGLAILLAITAAWILERHKWGLLLSGMCTALALGIYQAYTPMTIGIFVLLLIRQVLCCESSFWQVVMRGLKMCLALILGLVLYFAGSRLVLMLYQTSLSDYQGIGEMGKLALSDIPGLLWRAFYDFCALPVRNYCNLADTRLLKLTYLALGGISVLLIGYILAVKVKRLDMAVLTGLLCLVFPIGVNFIVIMCPDSWIYTLMVYSFVLVPCVPLVLLDCLPEKLPRLLAGKRAEKLVVLLLAVIIFGYANGANVNYTSMYYANRQVENYLNSIIVQARMAEGFDTEKKWAFIGDIEDPLIYHYWQDEPYYGGNNPGYKLMNKYSRNFWIQNYYGYSLPLSSAEEIQILSQTPQVRQMPCWPNEGSIQVVGDTVVIKFQELQS